MRLLIQVRGRTLDISVTRNDDEPQREPREVDLHSSIERADQWDHQRKEPIGYRRNG